MTKHGCLLWMGLILGVWPGLSLAEAPTMDDLHERGTLVEIDGAQLYVPRAAFPVEGSVDVIVHFHGGLHYWSREMERYGFNAVLVYFSPGGRSSAYATPFRDPARFARLLEESQEALQDQEGWPDEVVFDRVAVTSFSAGYGAVRELLKSPEYVERIDGVLLSDSLYAGYVGDAALRQVNPQQMMPFVDFAKRAVDGEKAFTVTHSTIVPPGYAGTHETADYLVAAQGLAWRPVDLPGPGGMHRRREAGAGRLTLIGAEGEDAIAHVIHLHEAGYFLNEMGVVDVLPTQKDDRP